MYRHSLCQSIPITSNPLTNTLRGGSFQQPSGSERTFTWIAGTGILAAKLAAKVALLAALDVTTG